MYVKILDSTQPLGSKLISEVKDIYKHIMEREAAAPAYDSSFIEDTGSEKVWRLYITNNNGSSYYLLADLGSVFIMNENGKTIDKF